jgi:AcrR family transcriptional regulator
LPKVIMRSARLAVRLTRQRVLEAALALVDADGLETLSMRKLGAALGVEAMSVYKHVANNDALLDGLVDQLWVEVRDGLPASAEWAEQLRAYAQTMRAAVHRHPQAASLLLSRCVLPVPMVEIYAALLDTLRDAGFDSATAARTVRSLSGYVLGYVSTELHRLGAWRAEPGEAPTASPTAERPEFDTTDVLLWLGRALPPSSPSRLVNAAPAMLDCDLDGDFDASLDMALGGLRKLRDHARTRKDQTSRHIFAPA